MDVRDPIGPIVALWNRSVRKHGSFAFPSNQAPGLGRRRWVQDRDFQPRNQGIEGELDLCVQVARAIL